MTFTVRAASRRYPVIIGHRHLNRLPQSLRDAGLDGTPVIITNPRVWRLGGAGLQRVLRRGGWAPVVLSVPDTEHSKSLAELGRVLTRLAALDGHGRLFIIAFGGGVVGDLAGLAAALYRRGIPYVQVPTTLLAQVDSAIGGKTAVDLPRGKNLVGAFYQPWLVFSDTAWLAGLPPRQVASGLAEVIKCGVIQDAGLFALLARERAAILAGRPAPLQAVIARAARIKARVVGADERETTGLRMILNFGHTIGHAVEAATHYSGRCTHGEAVAIGMRAATALARRLGCCTRSTEDRLNDLLDAYRLPAAARGVRPDAVMAALSHDKKVRQGRLHWVLPTRIGHVLVTPDVPSAMVQAVVHERIRP